MSAPAIRGANFPGPPQFANAADERRHRKERLAASFRLFSKFGFDEGVAGRGRVERGQDPHAGRFAGTVGPDVAEDLPALDAEGNIIDGLGAAEMAMQLPQFDQGVRGDHRGFTIFLR